MLWWIGALLVGLLSVAWALALSAAVGRGEKWVVDLGVAPWYGFHGGLGLLALWMVMKAVG